MTVNLDSVPCADTIHAFVITYGRDAKAVYDPIAARIARTLHQAR